MLLSIKFNREVTPQKNSLKRALRGARKPCRLYEHHAHAYLPIYVQFDLNFTSNSTLILRPIRPQFYVQFDLNFTSNSISTLRPIRSQIYVHFDLNFTSNSISILCSIRPQFYVQFDLNFTSNSTSIFLWSDVCISQNKAANATPPGSWRGRQGYLQDRAKEENLRSYMGCPLHVQCVSH